MKTHRMIPFLWMLFGLTFVANAQLQLVDHNPAIDAQNVPINSTIDLIFDSNIDDLTLTPFSVVITGSISGPIDGFLSGGGTNAVSFTPSFDFNSGEEIHVMVTEDLMNESGFSLPGPYQFSFTVVNSSGPDINEIGKILPTPNQKYTRPGEAIAIDGNIAVVGDPGYGEIENNSGGAYVLEYDGTDWNKIATLTASDGGFGDEFGSSVAISGGTIVVGSPLVDGIVANEAGAAYIFEMPVGGWTDMAETQKLVPNDLVARDQFGTGVAISGTTIVVTKEPNAFGNIGAAYVYENTGSWIQVDKLVPASVTASDLFGSSVAMEGTILVVGARQRTSGGAAFVFENTTGWNEVAELTASDRVSLDLFGVSVAISGSTIVAGASRDHITGTDEGSAYVFEEPTGGWISMTETQKITASNGSSFDYFGESVSISGTSLVVGSQLYDGNTTNTGGVYVYEYDNGISTWTERAILTATDGTINDQMGLGVAISDDRLMMNGGSKLYIHERPVGGWASAALNPTFVSPVSNAHDDFGSAIAIDGNTAVVGTPDADNLLGQDVGDAYVLEFDGTSWNIVAKLTPSDPVAFDLFGADVAIDGTTIIVGAVGKETPHLNGGAAYVFEQPAGGWVDMTETQKLVHSNTGGSELFGSSVAISGDRIAVGSPRDDVNKGSVVLFQKAGTWIEEVTLEASDRANGDELGISVAMEGTTIVAGASGDEGSTGAAYIFDFDGSSWLELAKLTVSDGAGNDLFGRAVDIEANTIAVGAFSATGIATMTGAAYIFEEPIAGWQTMTETQKVFASDGAFTDRFGTALSISNNLLVVGANFRATMAGANSGAAYVFANDGGWSEIDKLTASDGLAFDRFGDAIFIDEDQILIGASLHVGVDKSGAVYHFELDLPPSVIVSGPASPANSNPIPVTITFSEAVAGFDPLAQPTDVTLTNATLSGVATTDNITYTLQVVPTAQGLVQVAVPSSVAVDQATGLSNNEASNTFNVTYDIPPSVEVTSTSPNPTNGTIPVTITFDELVTGFDVSDITIANGTGSGFIDNGDGSYDLTVTATTDGVVEVSVAADVAIDAVGSGNTVSNTLEVTYDGTAPTAVITENSENPTRGTIPVTITFSELVAGFDASDVTITNGNGSDFIDNGDGSYDMTVTAVADGLEVSVAADVATDAAGNNNEVSNTIGITYDGTQPTVMVSTNESDPTNNLFIPITVTFSEIVTGFDESDLGSGGISGFTNNGDGSYDFFLEPAADLTYSITVSAAAAFDLAGNSNVVSNTLEITYDGTAPTVVIETSASALTNDAEIPVTIDFGETVTGFDVSDVTITNGTGSDFTDNGDGSYDLTVTAIGDGIVEVSVAADVATDAATNGNTVSNTIEVTYDGTSPTVVVSSTSPDPTNGTIPVTITFSEVVTGFDASDVTIMNGTGAHFINNGNGSYDLIVTANADGMVEVSVAADVATDEAGNGNTISNTFEVTYDGTSPSVAVTSTSPDPTNTTIPVTITFDELVTGFDVSDVTIANGTGSDFTNNGDGSYDLLVTALGDGAVEVSVPAGAGTDEAGNGNTASNIQEVTYDGSDPTVVIESSVGTVTNQMELPITITFDELVFGFEASDIDITNGTSSNFIDNGDGSYSLTVTAINEGLVEISVPSEVSDDAAGNSNEVSNTLEITYDPTALAVLITTTTNDPTNNVSIPITVDFGEVVTGFEVADITITNGTSSDFTDNGDGSYDLTVTALNDGEVSISVAADVAEDLASNGNQASNVLSVTYDGTAPTTVIETTASALTSVSEISVTVDFGEVVTGFEAADITITNGTSSEFTDNGDGSYDLTVTAVNDGEVSISVAAAVANDLASNANQASNVLSVTYDGTAPTTVIETTASALTNVSVIPITIDFGEVVSDFEISDITITNGTSSDFIDNGDGSYDLTVTAVNDGEVSISVAASAAVDLASNANQASNVLSVTYDGTAPTTVIETTASALTNVSVIPITIDFGEVVSDFEVSDITITNGTSSDFVDNGDGSYALTVTASSDGEVSISIASDVANDLAGNANQISNALSVTYDGTSPTVLVASSVGSVVSEATIPVTITFSEVVTEFDASDITIANGTSSDFVDNGDGSYSLTITALSAGLVSISVPSGVSVDLAGNDNGASNVLDVSYDPAAIEVMISTSSSDPTSSTAIPVTIDFGEIVTGFEVADVTIVNGTGSDFTDNGDGSFNLMVTPIADGVVTVQVIAGVVTNVGGSQNLTSNVLTINYDGTAPSVLVSTNVSDPTSDAAIPVTITFSEVVTGFDQSDITITNGTPSGFVDNGDGSFGLTVTASASGLVEVSVLAGVGSDAAGNTNTSSNSLQVTYNAPNNNPTLVGSIPDQALGTNGSTGESASLTLSEYFSDPDGDALIYTAESENVNIATATVSNETLTILAVDEGVSKITVTADDQLGGQVATDFDVTVTIVLSADGMPVEILTYPNPVTTDLTIKSDGFHISEWKLYGLRGDLRAEGHSSGATELVIDVRGFAAGTYILKLKSITDKTVDIRVRVNK